jgi:hypothetical protein
LSKGRARQVWFRVLSLRRGAKLSGAPAVCLFLGTETSLRCSCEPWVSEQHQDASCVPTACIFGCACPTQHVAALGCLAQNVRLEDVMIFHLGCRYFP